MALCLRKKGPAHKFNKRTKKYLTMELVRKKVHYLNWISFAKNGLVDLTLGTHTAGGNSGFYNMKYLAALPNPPPLMGSSYQSITIVLGSCFIKQPGYYYPMDTECQSITGYPSYFVRFLKLTGIPGETCRSKEESS